MLSDAGMVEQFPKSVKLFSDKNCDEKKNSGQASDQKGSPPALEPFIPRKIGLGEKNTLLAGLLRDFSPHDVPVESVEILPLTTDDDSAMESLLSVLDPEEIPAIVPEIEAARLEGFAGGLAQGRKEMQAELSQQFDAERGAWEVAQQAAIEAARAAMVSELAANMDESLALGLEKIRCQIEHTLAGLIADLVGKSLTKAAVADFAAKITAEALAAEKPIIIEGKKQLLDVFAAQTTLSQEDYQLQEAALNEVRVVLADGVISTRLAPLMQELENLIEDEAR